MRRFRRRVLDFGRQVLPTDADLEPSDIGVLGRRCIVGIVSSGHCQHRCNVPGGLAHDPDSVLATAYAHDSVIRNQPSRGLESDHTLTDRRGQGASPRLRAKSSSAETSGDGDGAPR